MKFTLTIDMNNAAFDDTGELQRIVWAVGDGLQGLVRGDEWQIPIRDINGNVVGKAAITED